MTTIATQSPRNTVSPIVYRMPLDNTEATAEFDYQDTTARTHAAFPGYAFTEDGRTLSLLGKEPYPLKPGRSAAGTYCYVNIGRPPLKRSQLQHIVHARCCVPNPEGKSQVNHKDGNPRNNAASNLEWVTPSENIRHANALRREQGRGRIRTTPEQRAACVELRAGGMPMTAIATRLGLSHDSVRYAINSAKKRAAKTT